MTIIQSIKDYIATCPLINGEININYLGPRLVSYTIENVPENPIVKRYSDGGTLRQYCFLLASREAFDENTLENIKVAEFLEKFERWITKNNNDGILPNINETNLKAESIEVIESGYLADTARTSARFQIKLRLLYRQNN